MNRGQAERAIESLRMGIPPEELVRHFTVGRSSEIRDLTRRLESGKRGVLLLHANYGSGKTHLLSFIREAALDNNYAISSVAVDSRGGVRFNRMDQVLGAICRKIEVPGSHERGIKALFDLCSEAISTQKSSRFWAELTTDGKWDESDVLNSPALFVAFRAWCTGDRAAHDLVEDWLSQPWVYRTQRKKLYQNLVERQRRYFRESRLEWKFYADEVLVLNTQNYRQCWASLGDLHTLAKNSGLKGLVLLFDEYEDVITNLNNVLHQEQAFWNLFQFYSGKDFPGMSFFAVTPEFSNKCKTILQNKDRYDFDYSKFDKLLTFKMSPLTRANLLMIAGLIRPVHDIAYDWISDDYLDETELDKLVSAAARVPIEDRTRQVIRLIVRHLDDLFEKAE